MPRKNLVNAVDAALDADVDAVVTSISVDDSTLLPPVPFYVVVNPFDDVNREYMECTALTSNTLTVVRNLAGSVGGVGHPHLAGATVRVAIMAQHIEDLWDAVEATTPTEVVTLTVVGGTGTLWRNGNVVSIHVKSNVGVQETITTIPYPIPSTLMASAPMIASNGFPTGDIVVAQLFTNGIIWWRYVPAGYVPGSDVGDLTATWIMETP